QAQVLDKRPFIYGTLHQKFADFAASMTRTVQSQIDEVRAEQDRIIRQKRDEKFSVEQEKQRLEAVGSLVARLFTSLSEAALGWPLQADELERVAEGRSISSRA